MIEDPLLKLSRIDDARFAFQDALAGLAANLMRISAGQGDEGNVMDQLDEVMFQRRVLKRLTRKNPETADIRWALDKRYVQDDIDARFPPNRTPLDEAVMGVIDGVEDVAHWGLCTIAAKLDGTEDPCIFQEDDLIDEIKKLNRARRLQRQLLKAYTPDEVGN